MLRPLYDTRRLMGLSRPSDASLWAILLCDTLLHSLVTDCCTISVCYYRETDKQRKRQQKDEAGEERKDERLEGVSGRRNLHVLGPYRRESVTHKMRWQM